MKGLSTAPTVSEWSAEWVADATGDPRLGSRGRIAEPKRHVRNILNKLGFNSRVQIAAWIAADQ
ncbi:MAG: hypothetical protein M3072_05910 [Candidatus Dormibacteraeota bacterium]|nr:hypothetical protein [Candidatus Dormibacteraeota bacterium]